MDVLNDVVGAINHSVSRVTGLRPIDIKPANAQKIWERVYGNDLRAKKKPKYVPGDKVRITRAKKIFEKGYFPNYSDGIFEVGESSKAKPNYYQLKDYQVRANV